MSNPSAPLSPDPILQTAFGFLVLQGPSDRGGIWGPMTRGGRMLFRQLMSPNMLIELGDACDYTGSDFRCLLAGPASAAIAYK